MNVVPAVSAKRFEQLDAGDLFLFCVDGEDPIYALKTQLPETGDPANMVLLGPSFTRDLNEAFLLPWKPVTVLSLGKEFSIFPSLVADSWSTTGPNRAPVCLAVSGNETYVCANGASSPQHFFPSFVEVRTGKIVRQHLNGAIFTNVWEIAVLGANHPPRSILKFPLSTE